MKKYILMFVGFSLLFTACKKDEPEPVASFTTSGDNRPAPCEVTFTNQSTNATTYLWEFGDGATSSETNTKHTYTTGGTFNVKLTATGEGGSHTIEKSVTIQNLVAAPVANFSFSGANGFAPCKITFTNTSSNATTFLWDFGDGQSSTAKTPSHVYNAGGTFNVTLTAKNSTGTTDVINKSIVVKNKPTKLKINKLVVTALPFTTSSGGGWDISNGPDVYFKLSDDAGVNYFSSSYFSDVVSSSLPLNFTDGLPITINNLYYNFRLELWDYDTLDADDWMGGYYFNPSEYMPTDGSQYPTTINFQSSSSAIKFTLTIEWVQ